MNTFVKEKEGKIVFTLSRYMLLRGVRSVFIMLELHEQFRFPVSALHWQNNCGPVWLFRNVGVVRTVYILLMTCSTKMWDMSQ
jgi:hypothetical protein